ncbi:Glutathione S-transferase [Melia azedarach]|uniref:Glutathione S-transferase n=1 Tax=Melia azedarach TaxID=155640 RepID=A0ACC1YU78_MELAZ|nr:Glutathione S-transferase [Melia azedarach]
MKFGITNLHCCLLILTSELKARFWGDYIDKKIYPNGSKLWLSGDDEVRKSGVREMMESFKVLEAELGDKSYFGGETFGFVDVALIPFYSYFYTFEMLGNLSVEAQCPKLVTWGKRCMQEPSVAKTLCDPSYTYQGCLGIKKMLGFM